MMTSALRFLLCLVCWLGVTAHAQAQPRQALVPAAPQVSLAGHLDGLQDPSDRLTVADVDGPAAGRFAPLAGPLNAGFVGHTVWLRLEVAASGPSAEAWVLALSSPLIASVALYQRGPDGHWTERLAGEDHLPAAGELGRITPAFRLTLAPGSQRLYLRLRSRTPLVSALDLWAPQAYLAAEQRTAMGEGLYFGACGLLLLVLGGAWRLMRDRRSLWCLVYAAVTAAVAALTAGSMRLFWPLPGPVSDMLLGVGISLGLGVSAHVLLDLLDIARWQPRLTRALRQLAWALAGISSALILAGHYALGAPLAQGAVIALLIFIAVDLAWQTRRGRQAEPLQLVAVGIFALGIGLRLLRNLGVVEPGTFTDNGYRVALLMHLLVMGSALVHHYRRLYTDRARSQAQSEFFAMASHEFRTPLAIIDTALQQLEAEPDVPAERRQHLHRHAGLAVARMTSLMDDYLSLDRLESESQMPDLVPLSLPGLLKAAAAEWPDGRVRLNLELVDMAAASCLQGDPDLLLVAVRNLLANADRHAPKDQPIELGASLDGLRLACVSVRDAGPGIPADELQHIFSKYFRGRAAQRHPGTGLGLHLVRRIAELHHGSVAVSSSPGQGACFTLRLPMAAP